MVTPLQKADNLAKFFQTSEVYLKREDLHPLCSHKGRSIPPMIDHYRRMGTRSFVISSSGNAALAAGMYIKEINRDTDKQPTTLQIFIGQGIDKEKLSRLTALEDDYIKVTISDRPKKMAREMANTAQTTWLRQSTDDTALAGYEELAKEIIKQLPNVQAIFVPTSSGTTALGLGLALEKMHKTVAVYIVQTTACHPFVLDDRHNEKSVAGAIVDKVGLRKPALLNMLKNHKSQGYVATDEEIILAQEELKQYEALEASPNSALALAGFKLALKSGLRFSEPVILLITGR